MNLRSINRLVPIILPIVIGISGCNTTSVRKICHLKAIDKNLNLVEKHVQITGNTESELRQACDKIIFRIGHEMDPNYYERVLLLVEPK